MLEFLQRHHAGPLVPPEIAKALDGLFGGLVGDPTSNSAGLFGGLGQTPAPPEANSGGDPNPASASAARGDR